MKVCPDSDQLIYTEQKSLICIEEKIGEEKICKRINMSALM